jgi:hypothetical protein
VVAEAYSPAKVLPLFGQQVGGAASRPDLCPLRVAGDEPLFGVEALELVDHPNEAFREGKEFSHAGASIKANR